MQSISHKVKHQHQPTATTCSQTALSILLSHYGQDMDPVDIESKVPVGKDENGNETGSINQQLAEWCVGQGYDVVMYTFDCQVIDQSWSDMTSQQVLERLKLRKNGWVVPGIGELWTKQYTQAYIDYLEAGGTLHIQPYVSTKQLYSLLDKGPILPVVTFSTLYGVGRSHYNDGKFTRDDIKGRAVNHSIVIYGYDDNGNFLVADPDKDRGLEVIEPERMLAAISTAQIECDNLLFQLKRRG